MGVVVSNLALREVIVSRPTIFLLIMHKFLESIGWPRQRRIAWMPRQRRITWMPQQQRMAWMPRQQRPHDNKHDLRKQNMFFQESGKQETQRQKKHDSASMTQCSRLQQTEAC